MSDIYYGVPKRLVDIDDQALGAAQAELGAATMKETVNEALLRAVGSRNSKVAEALDQLSRLSALR